MQFSYEILQNVKPVLQNHIAKNILLGAKLSFIFNKFANLHSAN